MLFRGPGKPTKIKNKIYLTATTILGILLSFLLYAFLEFKYINWALQNGQNPNFSYDYFYWGIFLVLGATLGFLVGKFWWRKIYIERTWIRNGKRKK